MPEDSIVPFTAFLSHRYKSVAVNEYFFELSHGLANVQFEVDRGTSATSVTRLERKIRDADAFIGIYPFAESSSSTPDRDALLKASSYFRLELDIAARARKPGIVFVDRRFGTALEVPRSMTSCGFHLDEVSARAASPSAKRLRSQFSRFCARVASATDGQAENVADLRPVPEVGVLLPHGAVARGGYTPDALEAVVSITRAASREPIVLPWPPRLDAPTIGRLDEMDWLVTDVRAADSNGMLAYVHGRGIPTVRLSCEGSDEIPQATDVEMSLYGAHDVGYPKDIVRWRTQAELVLGFKERVRRLDAPSARITNAAEATAYFRGAAKRNEAVFVSYSGTDREIARDLVAALKRRFQEVFDYRDGGESLPAGSPWIEQVFERLAKSAVGIALLSSGYLSSGNCIHEAQEMVARKDSGRGIRFLPIKLREAESLSLPPWMTDTQYLRLWEHDGVERVADRIVEFISK